MDFNHYCRHCGQKVEEVSNGNGPRIFQCECMERKLNFNEVISGWTRQARVDQLKAMHNLMLNANDESIYMSWIYTMPDCPTEEDFIDIAMDNDSYNDCFDKFVRLIAKNGNRW